MATRAITRREAIKHIAALSCAGLSIGCSKSDERARYFSACEYSDGRYGLQVLGNDLSLVTEKHLPGRGHAIVACPHQRHIVAIARRPGTYLTAYDFNTGKHLEMPAARGRHFYGHGCFSADASLFFTTENDYESRRGVIGVRDVKSGFRQVAEWAVHGIGPHELLLKSDNRTLAVAIGGIQTHPESGRRKLNLPTMQSSLVTIDIESGELLHQHSLSDEYRLLSIRHIAEGHDGTLCLAMQYQGPRFDRVPLVGFQNGDDEIDLRYASRKAHSRMRNYCGSVTADRSGRLMAVSAPRGGLVTFWDISTGAHISTLELEDCCGITQTARANQFVLSSGTGDILEVSVSFNGDVSVDRQFRFPLRWDNHLTFSTFQTTLSQRVYL